MAPPRPPTETLTNHHLGRVRHLAVGARAPDWHPGHRSMSGQIVCDTCRMKIPSDVHATAHRIVMGHQTRVLDDEHAGTEPCGFRMV